MPFAVEKVLQSRLETSHEKKHGGKHSQMQAYRVGADFLADIKRGGPLVPHTGATNLTDHLDSFVLRQPKVFRQDIARRWDEGNSSLWNLYEHST